MMMMMMGRRRSRRRRRKQHTCHSPIVVMTVDAKKVAPL